MRRLCCLLAALPGLACSAPAAHLSPIHEKLAPNIFRWSDTCNVYVIRNGDAALLIDLGDGSVLDHLSEIGVTRVEWVLFTHHHREQCQGAPKLQPFHPKIAAPEAERELFEHPTNFRKMNVTLGDKFTVYGSSYVRPPIQPIPLDRTFKTNDTFSWRGFEFLCIDTRGNSPGSISYFLRQNGRSIAFTGDLILQGAKMHTWFDTEWDYGFAAGIKALRDSVARLTELKPDRLLPSHGDPITRPLKELTTYSNKLVRLERLYIRGYDPEHGSVAYQDKVSKPTIVSNVWQISPHLFKFKRLNFWPNFSLIMADDGHALLSDCGLLDENFLDTALEGMREHFGLKAIDAVIVSHMHGDHFLEAEHLRQKWGTQVWALENMVDKMEHPEWFDYAAPIQAYEKKKSDGSLVTGVHVDRAFKSGESFDWRGYNFTIDWMPGQTEFALCLHGMIDGRHIAFTGDNIFGDPDNPNQTGHEAMVAHNSAILEDGYIYGSEYLKRLHPDLLMGGHSFVMDHPAPFIERYRKWSYQMRDAFRDLSSEKDYRYWFDPFWLRAEPYRLNLKRGQSAEIKLHLRNFNSRSQEHHIEIACPPGVTVATPTLDGSLSPDSRTQFPIRFQASGDALAGVHIVAFDVTLNGRPYGQRFDCILDIEP